MKTISICHSNGQCTNITSDSICHIEVDGAIVWYQAMDELDEVQPPERPAEERGAPAVQTGNSSSHEMPSYEEAYQGFCAVHGGISEVLKSFYEYIARHFGH